MFRSVTHLWLPFNATYRAQERNERLFYRVLYDYIEELLPIVHMPTVGIACQKWGLMFRSIPRGLFLTYEDKGKMLECIKNWPERRVRYARPTVLSYSIDFPPCAVIGSKPCRISMK